MNEKDILIIINDENSFKGLDEITNSIESHNKVESIDSSVEFLMSNIYKVLVLFLISSAIGTESLIKLLKMFFLIVN